MRETKEARELQEVLADAGFKSVMVPIERLKDLQARFIELKDQLDPGFYNEWFPRFKFEAPDDFTPARSVIVTAARQPKIRMVFHHNGSPFPAIIPPTYHYGTDQEVWSLLAGYLLKHGLRAKDARVPVKSLAVHAGLAVYGRNNITYIDGWGSFFRWKAYISDVPPSYDTFGEPGTLEECETCTACVDHCPTRTISTDRFLIEVEKCLTYFNESDQPFPNWIDPSWHNCIIGCMICQEICPANRDVAGWEVEGPTFSEEETNSILKGTSKNDLPETVSEKLRQVDLLDGYEVLPRNLGALIG
jgi:epoxyqueuosine reductase